MTPTLLLPGDWTSPRLLVRILTTIGSDWALGATGLVERSTGVAATLRMGPADDELADKMRAGDDPVYPSLTEERVEAIAGHKAVLELTCDEGMAPRRACRALLSCGAALVDAGAHAVWVPTGLAHGPERWQSLAESVRGDDVVEAGSEDEGLVLYRAFVRPIVPSPEGWTTRGLTMLGHREVVVDADVPEPYAYDVLEALGQRLVCGPGLAGGEVLQPGKTGPKLLVSKPLGDGEATPWRVTARHEIS